MRHTIKLLFFTIFLAFFTNANAQVKSDTTVKTPTPRAVYDPASQAKDSVKPAPKDSVKSVLSTPDKSKDSVATIKKEMPKVAIDDTVKVTSKDTATVKVFKPISDSLLRIPKVAKSPFDSLRNIADSLRAIVAHHDTVVVVKRDTVVIVKKDTIAIVKDTVKKPVYVEKDPYKIRYYINEIPFKRKYFHEDKIDKELRRADLADGALDHKIVYHPDTSFNATLTKAILEDAAFLQVMVENMPIVARDSFSDNQERIRYLKAIYNLIAEYNRDNDINPEYYKNRVANLHDFLIAANEDRLGSFVVKNTNVYTLDNSKLLLDAHKDLRAYIYTRIGKLYPKMMMRRISEFVSDTFAATIIKADSRLEPNVIFNYATSTNRPIAAAIHRTNDAFVQAICKIADQSKSPVKAMAFLGEIYSGRKTVQQVDSIAEDPDLLFKNLVKLKLEGDTIAINSYAAELGLRSLKYIREMNERHETTDVFRFKCLEQMSAAEIYYVIVNGQDEIYTSSFLGSFKRLMEKIKPMKGDAFLASVNNDHFRTFIRMCAGYNTLSDFLATMDSSAKTTLMSRFIDNLQNMKEDDLEDAVDVADAFGSITDTTLASFLQKRVKANYELSYKQRSKKGVVIYSLLARLFEGNSISNSDTGAKVISQRMGLPNINMVAYKDLISDSGIVYQQVFFFGDEDGQVSFDHFMEIFRGDRRWRISQQKYWATITSVTGKKVVIYANQPLPQPDDDIAIDSLTSYLTEAGIHPSIMIHRGHSYHLPTTITKLNKYVKVVILGSCGGYHNLTTVLLKSPEAHIISSKQTGTMWVNDEILKSFNNSIIAGEDANWITMWRGLEVFFNKRRNEAEKEKFSDYVPPYKNLGAIFIKAYKRMMEMK